MQVGLPHSLRLGLLPTSFKLPEGGLQTPSITIYKRVCFFLNLCSQELHRIVLPISPDIFTHFHTIPSTLSPLSHPNLSCNTTTHFFFKKKPLPSPHYITGLLADLVLNDTIYESPSPSMRLVRDCFVCQITCMRTSAVEVD